MLAYIMGRMVFMIALAQNLSNAVHQEAVSMNPTWWTVPCGFIVFVVVVFVVIFVALALLRKILK